MGVRLLCLLLLTVPLAARADASHHTFWSVKGDHNTLYMLGSVHVLKPSDSDLPPEALQAYASAKALVMELDLNAIGPEQLLGSSLELESLPEGQTLKEVLGMDLYDQFLAHATPLGLDPDLLDHFQPWFAAVTLEQLELTQSGFASGSGVDEQFAQRAMQDHKPIIALESIDQQLGFFAHLSMEQQKRFLLYTLDDKQDTSSGIEAIVSAWRNGDTKSLEQELSEGYEQFPDLYRILTTERNRRWLPVISGLLHESENYLVVVGALHLVGSDGLVELLRKQGFEVVQH